VGAIETGCSGAETLVWISCHELESRGEAQNTHCFSSIYYHVMAEVILIVIRATDAVYGPFLDRGFILSSFTYSRICQTSHTYRIPPMRALSHTIHISATTINHCFANDTTVQNTAILCTSSSVNSTRHFTHGQLATSSLRSQSLLPRVPQLAQPRASRTLKVFLAFQHRFIPAQWQRARRCVGPSSIVNAMPASPRSPIV